MGALAESVLPNGIIHNAFLDFFHYRHVAIHSAQQNLPGKPCIFNGSYDTYQDAISLSCYYIDAVGISLDPVFNQLKGFVS
jgi:hypothetical protein